MTTPRAAYPSRPPTDRPEREEPCATERTPTPLSERDYLMVRRRALKAELDALDQYLGINPFGKRSRTDTVRYADRKPRD